MAGSPAARAVYISTVRELRYGVRALCPCLYSRLDRIHTLSAVDAAIEWYVGSALAVSHPLGTTGDGDAGRAEMCGIENIGTQQSEPAVPDVRKVGWACTQRTRKAAAISAHEGCAPYHRSGGVSELGIGAKSR